MGTQPTHSLDVNWSENHPLSSEEYLLPMHQENHPANSPQRTALPIVTTRTTLLDDGWSGAHLSLPLDGGGPGWG